MQFAQPGPIRGDLDHTDARGRRSVVRKDERESLQIHPLVRNAVGRAQCREVHAVRGAENTLEDTCVLRVALFEQFEDSAAVVVRDDDGEVLRPRLRRPDEQARCVVQEGQVAEQRDGPSLLVGECGTDGGGDRTVDPGDTAVGQHLHVGLRVAHERRVAHRVRRPEQQLVAGLQRIRDHRGDVQSGGLRVPVELGAHGLVGVRRQLAASFEPRLVGCSRHHGAGAVAMTLPRRRASAGRWSARTR